jgi:hypothetical protein
VEKLSLAFFYRLGSQLSKVAAVPVNAASVTEAEHQQLWADAYFANSQAQQLLQPPWSMRVARGALSEFGGAVDRYSSLVFPSPTQNPPQVTPFQLDAARRQVILKALDLQTIVQAEWGTWAAYFVPQQGIYQTDDLIDRADFTLPAETRNKLGDEVLAEVREAGRCLAFGVPTASGFHMMRAVEAVVWSFCQTVEIPDQPKPRKSQNWGVYTGYLSKSEEPDVKEVLALMQQLKDNQRNLIMHIEKVLTPNDAFRLFEEGQSAIISMADRLASPSIDDVAVTFN